MSGGLLLAASFVRVAVEISCWRAMSGKNADALATAEEVEAQEMRYIGGVGLFGAALALMQWLVLVLPGGEPFRLLTIAGVLIFLVSAPGRACGSPRAVVAPDQRDQRGVLRGHAGQRRRRSPISPS